MDKRKPSLPLSAASIAARTPPPYHLIGNDPSPLPDPRDAEIASLLAGLEQSARVLRKSLATLRNVKMDWSIHQRLSQATLDQIDGVLGP